MREAQRPIGNQLSKRLLRLSFAAHAEVNFPQQNPQSSRETVQNYRARQSFARAIVSPPSSWLEARQAQTPAWQNADRRQNRRSTGQSKPAVRLTTKLRFRFGSWERVRLQLARRFGRTRLRFRTVKIAPIILIVRRHRARALQRDQKQERNQFHRHDDKTRDCTMSIPSTLLGTSLRVSFRSVRGYGLRADEPRQG